MSYIVVKFLKDETVGMGLRKWLNPSNPAKIRWSREFTNSSTVEKFMLRDSNMLPTDPEFDVKIVYSSGEF